MKNAANSESTGLKQISLVILRLEIDDLNPTDRLSESALIHEFNQKNSININASLFDNPQETIDEPDSLHISNSSHPNIHSIFNFNSPTTESVCEESEELVLDNINSHKRRLGVFIGKREPRLISIETYFFNQNNCLEIKEPMHQSNSTKQSQQHKLNNQQLVNNAMTMQQALETAYNDWNRDKTVIQEPSSVQMEAHKEEVLEDVVLAKEVITPLVESSIKNEEKIETKKARGEVIK